MSNDHRRPFGLYIIVILQILQLSAWGLFLYLQARPAFAEMTAVYVDVSKTSTIVQIASTLLLFIALPGAWMLRRWGWILLVFQLGVSLAMGIWQVIEGAPNYIIMSLNVVVVFYLNQRDLRQVFDNDSAANAGLWK